MDKDLSIACYAKDNNAAAIVSNDSDMILFARVLQHIIFNTYFLDYFFLFLKKVLEKFVVRFPDQAKTGTTSKLRDI